MISMTFASLFVLLMCQVKKKDKALEKMESREAEFNEMKLLLAQQLDADPSPTATADVQK